MRAQNEASRLDCFGALFDAENMNNKADRLTQLAIQELKVDLSEFGINASATCSTEELLQVASGLYPNHSFPRSKGACGLLLRHAIGLAKAELAELEFSPQSHEEMALGDHWETYKYIMQRGWEGYSFRHYEEFCQQVSAAVAIELADPANRLLQLFELGAANVADIDHQALSEFLYEQLQELAKDEPLLRDLELAPVVDDAGRQLWQLKKTDRPLFEAVEAFLAEQKGTLAPPEMYEVAVALNYLRRLPRETVSSFYLSVGDESQYASVSGNEEKFELEATTENESECSFCRTRFGDTDGDGRDVYRWIETAAELIARGGRLKADLFAHNVEWDDGESDKYWRLMQ